MAKKVRLPAGFTRRPDGSLMYRFTVDKARYTVYGRTTQECREKELKRREALKNAIPVSDSDKSVSDFWDSWIKQHKKEVRGSSIKTYDYVFNVIKDVPLNCGRKFGELKMIEVQPSHIREVMDFFIKKGDSTAQANYSLTVLHAMFRSALNDRVIPWDPCAKVKRMRRTEPKITDSVHRALTTEELDKFFAAAEGSWYLPLFTVLRYTGMRVSEAGGLKPTDVNEKDGIHVQRTLTFSETSAREIGKDTKTAAGNRVIPLYPEVQQAIRKQRKLNMELFDSGTMDNSKVIFRSVTGRFIIPSTVNNEIERICRKAGIERFAAHAFRDSFATHCAQSGMDPEELKQIMGHSTITVTLNYYIQSDPERMKQQLLAANL